MMSHIAKLLSETADAYRRNLAFLLIGAIAVSFVVMIVQGLFVTRISTAIPELPPSIEEMMQDIERVRELETTKEGREEYTGDLQELESALMRQEEEVLRTFLQFLPAIALTAAASGLVLMIGPLFYILVGVHEGSKTSLAGIVKKIPRLTLPFLLLLILLFLRSFLWLSALRSISMLFVAVALVIAFSVLPRFLLSPVLLVREGIGVFGSMRRSKELTEGKWQPMALSLLLIVVLSSLAGYVLLFIALVVGAVTTSVYITLFLETFASELIVAFNAIFLVRLAKSVPVMTVKRVR